MKGAQKRKKLKDKISFFSTKKLFLWYVHLDRKEQDTKFCCRDGVAFASLCVVLVTIFLFVIRLGVKFARSYRRGRGKDDGEGEEEDECDGSEQGGKAQKEFGEVDCTFVLQSLKHLFPIHTFA